MKAKEYKRMLAVVLSAGMMAVQPASVMAGGQRQKGSLWQSGGCPAAIL